MREWRATLKQPELPFLLVELAAYCNEHDSRTDRSWCDQNTSAINTTDYDLPEMRIAQGRAAKGMGIYVETAADLGSVHPAHGSIHPVAKQELGARLALAALAAAGDAGVIWEGPEAVTAKHAASGGAIEVEFNVSRGAGGVALNTTAACPPVMTASPLGKLCCTGAGFELRIGGSGCCSGGVWVRPSSAALAPGKLNSIILKLSAESLVHGGKPTRVRYAYVDWPVNSVRNQKSSGGSTTVPLPARLFDMPICDGAVCPGDVCCTPL